MVDRNLGGDCCRDGLRTLQTAANLVAIIVCSLVNFVLGDRFVFEAGPTVTSISM